MDNNRKIIFSQKTKAGLLILSSLLVLLVWAAPARASQIVSWRLPILMYHYVEPLTGREDSLRRALTTTDQALASQFEYLAKNNYVSCTVADVAYLMESGKKAPAKSISLTFDDGYEDFYQYVFPLLQKYHLKATVYVIYDAIGAPGYLNEKQIGEMAASGLVEIGSHGLDHKDLAALAPEAARRQIFLSKELFEKRFKIKVRTFAYPYGSYNEAVAKLAAAAGYDAAVSTKPGYWHQAFSRFSLTRLRHGGLAGAEFGGWLASKR